MTKQEIYAKLKAAGIEVADYRKATKEQLEAMLSDINGADKQVEAQSKDKPPMLYFPGSGWCEALKCSYFMGYYKPATWKEYEALKQFANGSDL